MLPNQLNEDVSEFLNNHDHPLRNEIEQLRHIILTANKLLKETIKWNGPNYSIDEHDRITIKIHPSKNIQIVFHCGAKVQKAPKEKLICSESDFLTWKSNDRAVATFKNMDDILNDQSNLSKAVKDWIAASI